jgi:hypothetical protein
MTDDQRPGEYSSGFDVSSVAPMPPLERVGGPRRGRPAWLAPLVGLVIVGLLAAAGVFVVLSSQASDAAVRKGYAYVPDTAFMAMELRLDLPGNQRDEVVRFLSHFPDLADSAAIEQKFSDMVNDALASATSDEADYDRDIKPWFSGWVIVAGWMDESGTANRGFGSAPSVVAIVGTADRPAAEASLERLRNGDRWTTTEGAHGQVINTSTDAWSTQAYTVTDDAIVLGSSADVVNAALMAQAGDSRSLVEQDGFTKALDAMPANRLGLFWMDPQAYGKAFGNLYGMGGQNPFDVLNFAACQAGSSTPTAVPPIVAALYLREGKALFDERIEWPAESTAPPEARDDGLAASLPADTFLFADQHELGTATS